MDNDKIKQYNTSPLTTTWPPEKEEEETKAISDFNQLYKELSPLPLKDNVNHPSHYTWLKTLCGIEVIDITRHMDFDLGNALKYLLRAGHKHEEGMSDKEKQIEDLHKAIFYIEDEIKLLENNNK